MLNYNEIQDNLKSKNLIITPVLEKNQIKDIGIDLRLGTKFKVSRQTRKAYISINDDQLHKFFDETQREFGEDFILFPGQLVLANTFEYIKIPKNLIGHLFSRSSINRLGIRISSIIQPGYRGTLTLELLNKGENPINLKVGMRLVQLLLSKVNSDDNTTSYYQNNDSKYFCNIEPKISKISKDKEIFKLNKYTGKV